MLHVGPYLFKCADNEQEYQEIHRLNYQTFVDEIPQYEPDGSGRLVDKFHHKNTYFIALKNNLLVGMLSAHDQPPFSVESRLQDPSILSQPGMKPLEVRLLAISPTERNSTLFFGLIWVLYDHALKHNHSHLVISGVVERQRLYESLGFTPLGKPVACGRAAFVPMILAVGKLPKRIARIKSLWENHVENRLKEFRSTEWSSPSSQYFTSDAPAGEPARVEDNGLGAKVCLLPGPVTMTEAVRQAFSHPPIYHRSPEFIERFENLRRLLGRLVGGREVAILNGSGTLANETVAGTLMGISCPGPGVLLINGEFGERLAKQAERFGFHPIHLRWTWGQAWNLEEVEATLAQQPPGSWVWGVHQESSTGVINDLAGLVRIASRYGVRVCVDCISSIGAVPLDLSGVFLASGSSGKSLGSYAGAALVFADPEVHTLVDRRRVPSYFDLVAALRNAGPCYTFPSSTLLALEAALQPYSTPEQATAIYAHYAMLGCYVRERLRRLNLAPLAAEECASPVVTTFSPPPGESSVAFVNRCLQWGVAIGGQSGYLAKRRLVQIATMGAVTRQMCSFLFTRLEQHLAELSCVS